MDILQYVAVIGLVIFAFAVVRNLYFTQTSIVEGLENQKDRDAAKIAKLNEKLENLTKFFNSMNEKTIESIPPIKSNLEDYLIAMNDHFDLARLLATLPPSKGHIISKKFDEYAKQDGSHSNTIEKAMKTLDEL